MAWKRRRPTWPYLVVLGGLLLTTDHEASEDSHYMYGIIALIVSLVAEGLRVNAAGRELPGDVEFEALEKGEQRSIAMRIVRRETLTMTLASWLIAIIVFRAGQTSGGLF